MSGDATWEQGRAVRWAVGVWVVLALGAVGLRSAGAGQSERRTPVVLAIQKVQPSVVSISSEKRSSSTTRWPFSPEESQRPRVSGMGTGVILDHRGYILTNQHVVDKVQGVEVQLADGSVYPAVVLQQDPVLDIAILKIEAGRPLQPVALGSSADLMVGETVISIGNAFGYENTTSVGVISALNRNVTLSDDQVYRNLIQTDASINPGNSGGPLINIDGEVIGINVAVRAGAQGIGFALPIDDVKRVATEMMSTRRLAATWHGVVASELVRPDGRAVLIQEVVPNSPAQAAGLRRGDQLIQVGDLPVTTPIDLERGLLDVRPGQTAQILIRRNGQDLAVALEPQPLSRSALVAQAAATAPMPTEDRLWRQLGLKLVPVSRDYVRVVSSTFRGGLYVQAVQPNSPADRARIQKGDILVGMNSGDRDWETIKPDNLIFILNQAESVRAEALVYYAVRKNEFLQGRIVLSDPQQAHAAGLRR
ncbi:MAG: serine protease [Isosphaeraceae bacterium]|jgi:serine protease Do|nr:MAG: serine protease [Isosphaeraceae bacterium]